MKLTCFGKYGPYPKAGSSTSCYLLEHGGKRILIELGCGALSKVLLKLEAADIDALFISHLHTDHMGDALTLRYLLKTAKVAGEIDSPLPVFMPAKPEAEAGLLSKDPMMDVNFIEDGMSIKLFGMDISFAFMPHPYPSYAIKFEADGKTFVYSGDTKENENLTPFAKDADFFLMEAALLEKDTNSKSAHLSAVEAGKIGMQANAKRMLITHIFPKYNPQDVIAEVRQNYKKAELIEENTTYEV